MADRTIHGTHCPSGAPQRVETDIVYRVKYNSRFNETRIAGICLSPIPDGEEGGKECGYCRFNKGELANLGSIEDFEKKNKPKYLQK